ncbi:MAG: amidase [Candidatus Rokuibacteriota bacterium]|nr:MAG: amidase [Candidatus Rokubacteria bacterium]
MDETPIAFASIADLAARIRAGGLSPVAVTEQVLARIEALDKRLRSFILVAPERALADARAAESALKGGTDLGPLHGIPYAAKDLFDVKGMATTAGTRLLAGHVAREDSAVVRKLAAAGMVLCGKTYTVQFAYGAVGINHDQGTPHNPWHPTPHAPGGSSSGSAVAVAAGLVPMALGSDTGGSVRVPAALCGIVGLKTTVGRISRAGVYPLAWTLDSVGPLTRTVEDAALVYQVLQGVDLRDETTVGVTAHDVLRRLKDGVKGLRVAFGETLFFDDLDPEVEKAVREAGQVFRALGAHLDSMAVPEAAEAWAEEKRPLLIAAEACAVNARFLDMHLDALDPVIGPRMITGRTLSAPDYFALLRRYAALRDRVQWTLGDVDALIVPTAMIPARPLATIDGSFERYLEHNLKYHRNAGVGNILNLCAVSVPCGFTAEGLPVGLMIYAKPFQEDVALRVAYAYEQATEWHARRPGLAWTGAGRFAA